MAQLINFKVMDNKICGYNSDYKQNIVIGFINHEQKEIRAAKGFDIGHPMGKQSKRYARRLGYVFNESI